MKIIDIYKPLPTDILHFINENFSDAMKDYVISLCSVYFANRIDNNYHENVIRAALFLSKGTLESLEENLSHGDYRDILLAAEEESGNYEHYFRMTFEEINELAKTIEKDLIQQINEYDNLPAEFYINGK